MRKSFKLATLGAILAVIMLMVGLLAVPAVASVSVCNLQPVQYEWGNYTFVGNYMFASIGMRIANPGDTTAEDVQATLTGWPANVEVLDGSVALGDIPAHSSKWSGGDTFTLKIDLTIPVNPYEGVVWRIEYNDAGGAHVLENVPEFPY